MRNAYTVLPLSVFLFSISYSQLRINFNLIHSFYESGLVRNKTACAANAQAV